MTTSALPPSTHSNGTRSASYPPASSAAPLKPVSAALNSPPRHSPVSPSQLSHSIQKSAFRVIAAAAPLLPPKAPTLSPAPLSPHGSAMPSFALSPAPLTAVSKPNPPAVQAAPEPEYANGLFLSHADPMPIGRHDCPRLGLFLDLILDSLPPRPPRKRPLPLAAHAQTNKQVLEPSTSRQKPVLSTIMEESNLSASATSSQSESSDSAASTSSNSNDLMASFRMDGSRLQTWMAPPPSGSSIAPTPPIAPNA